MQVHPNCMTFGVFRAVSSKEGLRLAPFFVVSKLQNRPTRRLDPRTSGHLVQPEGSTARTARANGGSTRVPRAKKIIFFKVVPRPLGMLKQVFLRRFEPLVARYGP